MASISDHQHHCASNQDGDGSVNHTKIAPHPSNNCPSHHAYAGVRPFSISSKYHKRKGWPRKMEIFCKTLNSSHIFLWLKTVSILLFDGKCLKSQMMGWEFLANQIISRPIIISSDLASHQIKVTAQITPILLSVDIGLALIVNFTSNQGQSASNQGIISSKSNHAHARWPPVMWAVCAKSKSVRRWFLLDHALMWFFCAKLSRDLIYAVTRLMNRRKKGPCLSTGALLD